MTPPRGAARGGAGRSLDFRMNPHEFRARRCNGRETLRPAWPLCASLGMPPLSRTSIRSAASYPRMPRHDAKRCQTMKRTNVSRETSGHRSSAAAWNAGLRLRPRRLVSGCGLGPSSRLRPGCRSPVDAQVAGCRLQVAGNDKRKASPASRAFFAWSCPASTGHPTLSKMDLHAPSKEHAGDKQQGSFPVLRNKP